MRGTQSESNLHAPSHPPKTSSRSYRACTWCRAHKRKCDGLEPCTTCANSPDGRKCEYAPPQKRGRKIKRQYDDKLTIEHVIKKRQDESLGLYPDVTPLVIDKTGPPVIPQLRLPDISHEGPTLNIFHSPIELPPPMPTSRYPDSITSPERYNFSSRYSLSSPEIRTRVYSQDSQILRLPQIFDSDDNISRQNSLTILPSPNRPATLFDSSSSLSLSGEPLVSSFAGLNRSNIESDSVTKGGSHSHPHMLSSRRLSLQHPYTSILNRQGGLDSEKEYISPPLTPNPGKLFHIDTFKGGPDNNS